MLGLTLPPARAFVSAPSSSSSKHPPTTTASVNGASVPRACRVRVRQAPALKLASAAAPRGARPTTVMAAGEGEGSSSGGGSYTESYTAGAYTRSFSAQLERGLWDRGCA